MRSPASSSLATILPVRLRAVASGLIIEKVRSTAMKSPVGSRLDRWRAVYRAGAAPPPRERELERVQAVPSEVELAVEFSRKLRARGHPRKGIPADKAFYDA